MKALMQAARYANYFGLGTLGMIGSAFAQAGKSATPFRAELRTVPAEVRATQPATLIIAIKDANGNTVRNLQMVHEKMLHLIVVSADLSEFAHLHPQQINDGSFQITHTLQYGGEYRLFADFKPSQGEPVIEKLKLKVEGDARRPVALVESAKRVDQDGLLVTMMTSKPLRAAEGVLLDFTIADAATNKPLTNLQPYLGALAHFVIISQDGADFLHAHPMEKSAMAVRHEHGGNDTKSHQYHSNAASAAEVSAHTTFPRPGLYKLWAQFQRNGRVMTAAFVVRVGK